MPFPAAHELFTAHGTMPGGEIWSVGLRADGRSSLTPSTLAFLTQSFAERFAALRNSLATAPTPPWTIGVTFLGVTGRYLNVAGITLNQVEAIPVLAQPPAASNEFLPNQCAIVTSLTTITPGRRGKGRIYLPLLGNMIANDGKHSAAVRISAAIKVFMDTLHADWAADAGAAGERLVVGSKVGAGALSPITQIKVGDVIDTQRRRRNAIPEIYSTRVLV